MTTTDVLVETERPYRVHVGPGVLARAGDAGDPSLGLALLADERVLALHGAGLGRLESVPRLELSGGEDAKTLVRLGEVLEFCASAGLSRGSTLVTLGGGTMGDLGGLAASLFKRGLGVVHLPTTLLSQVDASVGGKTAINLAAGKNLAGTFHQPTAVYCDTDTLRTLPARELASGLGEVVKTALVGGREALDAVERRASELLAADPQALSETVAACVTIKARVVAADPTEQGPRRALNLGHTFAHALEHAAGFGALPHGVAVAVGIVLALQASSECGLLEDASLLPRIQGLNSSLGLPSSLAELRETYGQPLPVQDLLLGLAHDKKGAVGEPEFVLVRSPGDLPLGVVLKEAQLESLLTS